MSAPSLSDPLVVAFEAATLDPARFRHREHLYVAFRYLEALPPEEALARYVRHLRKLTVALGVPQKFHATMTWAWVVLVHEAMSASPGASFDALLEAHPGLLDARAALAAHYDADVLASAAARQRFVLPRRG